MGLRPMAKKDETNSNSAPSNKQNNSEPPRDFDGNVRSGDGPPPPPTPRREAWTARGQLLLNFHDAISRAINSPQMARKCSQIAEDLSKPSSNGENRSMAEDYGAEAALIVESKSRRDAAVNNKSLALGAFSFVALRSGRGLGSWTKKMVSNYNNGGRSYQFESHLRSSVTASLTKNNHAMDHHSTELKQPSKLRKLLRLAVDTSISTAITVLSGAFLFMPRPAAYIQDMAKLPLVKGKSLYAEMVCPPLLDEYRRVLEQYGGRWPVRDTSDPDGEGITQEDVSLNVIRTFVENCSKRSAYERALIEERNALSLENDQSTTSVSSLIKGATRSNNADEIGSTGNENKSSEEGHRLGTVSIPSPGVPENIIVNLDQAVYSIGTEGNKENGKK